MPRIYTFAEFELHTLRVEGSYTNHPAIDWTHQDVGNHLIALIKLFDNRLFTKLTTLRMHNNVYINYAIDLITTNSIRPFGGALHTNKLNESSQYASDVKFVIVIQNNRNKCFSQSLFLRFDDSCEIRSSIVWFYSVPFHSSLWRYYSQIII